MVYLDGLLIRHGETEYTGKLPDLTLTGIQCIREVANRTILPWVTERGATADTIAVQSSPAPRAHGSAIVALEQIGFSTPITTVHAIGPMAWRDYVRCVEALNGLRGRGYIDYEDEACFADPTLFETPAEIRARVYRFLSDQVLRAINRSGATQPTILFTHYEVMCHLAHDLFGVIATEQTAIRHGEHIEITISNLFGNAVSVFGRFRDQEVCGWLDLLDHTLRLA